MVTRRHILTSGAVLSTAIAVPFVLPKRRAEAEAVPGGTLDPTTIPKYVTPLLILPAMPPVSSSYSLDTYSIAARRFSQQVLPGGRPATRWRCSTSARRSWRSGAAH